jgi:hypothetical protein
LNKNSGFIEKNPRNGMGLVGWIIRRVDRAPAAPSPITGIAETSASVPDALKLRAISQLIAASPQPLLRKSIRLDFVKSESVLNFF